MSPRDTSTGSAYESIVEQCVRRSCEKYQMEVLRQRTIGEKQGGGQHRISCKIQNQSGTAEEKIAYEVIKLLHAMEMDTRYVHSWIVMGGSGWSTGMRNFVNNELHKWVPTMKGKVSILTTDDLEL